MSAGVIIDEAIESLQKGIEVSGNKLYSILLKVLANQSNGGTLEANKNIVDLDKQLKDALRESGYLKAADLYLKTFENLDENNIKYYKTQKLNASGVISQSEIIPFLKDKVISNLKGTGAFEGVIKPLEELMKQEIFLKKSFNEVAEVLKIHLIEKPLLSRYVNQYAYESLRQYNGAIHDEVKKKFGLEWFNYIGSEIETTRPLCDHIRDNYQGSIHVDQLEQILKEFCPGGVPSSDQITYETVNNKKITAKKGSGMYNNTTIDDFSMKCGGHQCRHEVLWTRFPKNITNNGKPII